MNIPIPLSFYNCDSCSSESQARFVGNWAQSDTIWTAISHALVLESDIIDTKNPRVLNLRLVDFLYFRHKFL